MQLTRFDRWLRERFGYVTQIRTLRPPAEVPKGIQVIEEPEQPGKRYKHLFITTNPHLADKFIQDLHAAGQMFTTQIIDRQAWFVPFIAPKQRSVSWWLLSVMVFSTCAFFVLLYLKGLAEDPEFRQNFLDAIEVLKG